ASSRARSASGAGLSGWRYTRASSRACAWERKRGSSSGEAVRATLPKYHRVLTNTQQPCVRRESDALGRPRPGEERTSFGRRTHLVKPLERGVFNLRKRAKHPLVLDTTKGERAHDENAQDGECRCSYRLSCLCGARLTHHRCSNHCRPSGRACERRPTDDYWHRAGRRAVDGEPGYVDGQSDLVLVPVAALRYRRSHLPRCHGCDGPVVRRPPCRPRFPAPGASHGSEERTLGNGDVCTHGSRAADDARHEQATDAPDTRYEVP